MSKANQQAMRPGATLGSYPQREETERRFSDRIGDSIGHQLRQLRDQRRMSLEHVVNQVNDAAVNLPAFGTAAWNDRLKQLCSQLTSHGLNDDLVAMAFAMVRETSTQTLNLRHHDVQLLAAWTMVHGYLIEMATGEGKSLTATLAAACAGLAGIPVHIITTNEYLAARDALELQALYDALGLSCSVVMETMSTEQRRQCYQSDIVYCTNKQIAFDYLRDRLVMRNETSQLLLKLKQFDPASGPVLRGLCFAIVDEADSVLIDEACTPLLLSREVADPERDQVYKQALALAQRLEPKRDFHAQQRELRAELSEHGAHRLETWMDKDLRGGEKLNPIWQGKRRREWLIQQALSALHLYQADEHYLVRDQRIEIIDPHTGRSMPDHAWQEGLHQMLECKEGCALTGQRETLARISYQRFFLRYLNLTGMSGTLREVAAELQGVYAKPLLIIPPHKPRIARDLGTRIHADADSKWQAIVERVQQIHKTDQPVLLGTASVASSEHLSRLLRERGIVHQLLSARQDADEAQIISRAGLANAVTVATNMAGRGTDISLGDSVADLGGLHVIACEPNQSSRVDRQLFGRCGRHGEPGSFELFVSLEDTLVSNYLPQGAGRFAASRLEQKPHNGKTAAHWLTKIPQYRLQHRMRAQRRNILGQDRQIDDLLAFTGHSE